jgi:hypothetical protein
MMGNYRGGGYRESEEEERLRELSEHSGLSEKELIRLKTTTPQRVLYIVVGIALLLFLIVVIVGTNVFHW